MRTVTEYYIWREKLFRDMLPTDFVEIQKKFNVFCRSIQTSYGQLFILQNRHNSRNVTFRYREYLTRVKVFCKWFSIIKYRFPFKRFGIPCMSNKSYKKSDELHYTNFKMRTLIILCITLIWNFLSYLSRQRRNWSLEYEYKITLYTILLYSSYYMQFLLRICRETARTRKI